MQDIVTRCCEHFGDWWYWLKCRCFTQHNRVVCERLPPTWVDRDHLLLHTSFQILTDFVRKEKGFVHENIRALYAEEIAQGWMSRTRFR